MKHAETPERVCPAIWINREDRRCTKPVGHEGFHVTYDDRMYGIQWPDWSR
jgi:hypothetical protein